jgi:DNA-binding NtrC family response regulator
LIIVHPAEFTYTKGGTMRTEESPKPELLIVDDDPMITDLLVHVLQQDFKCHVADSAYQAKALLEQTKVLPRLALVDLGLPPVPHRPIEGFRLITELQAYCPNTKIIVLSGQDDAANARHARTLGAVEFIAKPCDPLKLKNIVKQILEIRDMETNTPVEGGILGRSVLIEKLRKQIGQFANAPFPVLIEGESGTGKELIAKSIHELSNRKAKPYIALNCAALSPSLVEPTLFGYVKGSFTGATTTRGGYFEDAQDATLFLDEIGELPVDMQAKLLRVLENGEYQRVGETQSRKSNARVVAATNRDMKSEIRAGRFRPDLYHRLSVFTIHPPPLRDLGDDKLLLLYHYQAYYSAQSNTVPFSLDKAAMGLWLDYSFPGNVRELRNIVIRLTSKYAGNLVSQEQLQAELDLESLDVDIPGFSAGYDYKATLDIARRQITRGTAFNLDNSLREWERAYVETALSLNNGNLTHAAKMLGINRTTLYSRMHHYATNVADANKAREEK